MIRDETDHNSSFEEARRARYERLSLLTLDLAEEAAHWAKHVSEREDHRPDRARDFARSMASMSKAIWAHQVVERLRTGRGLDAQDLAALRALGGITDKRAPSPPPRQFTKVSQIQPDDVFEADLSDSERANPEIPDFHEGDFPGDFFGETHKPKPNSDEITDNTFRDNIKNRSDLADCENGYHFKNVILAQAGIWPPYRVGDEREHIRLEPE